MAQLEGYIERIVYRNEENGYSVLIIGKGSEEVSAVGFFPEIAEGEYLEITGEVVQHPMYGEQWKITSYQFVVPSDSTSTERYLASGAIKGIKEALAKRIVKAFGDETFRIIEEEPERLAEVKGISERKAREIAAQVSEKRDARKAMIFLQEYGITLNLAAKIYQQYGQRLYTVIKENPYQLADDITGVGFKMADEIAKKSGIAVNSQFRIRSGIIYTLQQAAAQGHTYLPMSQLLYQVSELLQMEMEASENDLLDMAVERKLVIKNIEERQQVYLSQYYYMELNTAKMLHDLNIREEVPEERMEKTIAKIEKESGFELDFIQKMAVKEAIRNGLTIITGGPGTGKTTTINAIIHYFIQEGMDILLAAPTGRAAKRMTETTGYEAQTIHRMLELTGTLEDDRSTMSFSKNEENPLEADVVIIDEMSMVDIFLMHALLKAVAVGTRLILVGDVNQLPSVGAGNVLKDVIHSHSFPTVKLTKIFRQASESDIIVNAHKINDGEEVIPRKGSRDFLFIQRDNPGTIMGATITLVRDKLPNYVKAEEREIQVLTPMRKGNLGVDQINRELQQALNPPDSSKKEHKVGDVILREGDKVMQIKNNYQMEWEVVSKYNIPVDKGIGVFNGDIGFIREINEFTEQIIVEFDERKRVAYEFKQSDELELAYAVTIHKSQGSEYPAVVLPLLSGPRMLMTRNLLYTAVTRAKNCVCIVGSLKTFQDMIHNEQEQKRYSGLKDRIQELEGGLE